MDANIFSEKQMKLSMDLLNASQPKQKVWNEYTRDELIVKFMPLVENIARKFKDSDAANGVVSLSDRIQFGHIGLIKAVDKIIWKQIKVLTI